MVILASENYKSINYNTSKEFSWVFLTLLNTTLKVQTLFHDCLQKFDRFWVSTLFPYLSDISTNPTDNNGRLLLPCNGNVDNKTKDVSDVLSTSNDHSEMKKRRSHTFLTFRPCGGVLETKDLTWMESKEKTYQAFQTKLLNFYDHGLNSSTTKTNKLTFTMCTMCSM